MLIIVVAILAGFISSRLLNENLFLLKALDLVVMVFFFGILFWIFFQGRAMPERLIPQGEYFKVLAEYHDGNNQCLIVSFDGRGTLFLRFRDSRYDFKVGRLYLWNGQEVLSAK